LSDPFDEGDAPRREWTSSDRRRILIAALVSLALIGLLWFEGLSSSGDEEVASGPVGDWSASDTAASDVPRDLLRVYQEAATNCPGLPWPVVAAIGKVETDHNREPATSSAGEQGPMQFLPATWEEFQADGDGDGVADINDEDDAIYGAVRLLCAEGGGDPVSLQQAILAYDDAEEYLSEVLEVARSYTTGTIEAP
jgi:Transglycosylase SLT domain